MYCGSWAIDGLLTFAVNTHNPSTGAAADADADPAYRVYEDETGTPILTGTMSKLDDANTLGFYSEQLTLSAANGFERGKAYTVYVAAAVGGITGTTERHFQVGADVNVSHWGGNQVSNGFISGVGFLPLVYARLFSIRGDNLDAAAGNYATAFADVFGQSSTAARDLIAAALLDLANGVETNRTLRQALRGFAAALMGKVSGQGGGAPVFRDTNDTQDRISATLDASNNRTSVTLNLSNP